MIWGRCTLLGALVIVSAFVLLENTNADARRIDALRTTTWREMSRDGWFRLGIKVS